MKPNIQANKIYRITYGGKGGYEVIADTIFWDKAKVKEHASDLSGVMKVTVKVWEHKIQEDGTFKCTRRVYHVEPLANGEHKVIIDR